MLTERSGNLLNVRTAKATSVNSDHTGRARIRDAAIELFAAGGVDGTSVRAVAGLAGVSAGLVMHHFGSKDGLRVACDEYVAATVREINNAAAATPGADPLAGLRGYSEGPPLLRYLARTLVDGSPHVSALVDEMVGDAAAYSMEAIRAGTMTPSEQPHERAVVLTLWSLGALVLHEHVQRLLGVDITGEPSDVGPYMVPATEILANGVIPPEFYERIRDTFPPRDERVGPDARLPEEARPAEREGRQA